jgi:AcrR family transcriptional regulator
VTADRSLPAAGRPDRFERGALAGLPADVVMARLPAGRHGLPRSFVTHNQRLRIIAAMLRVLPEHGYAGLTIAHITREAGVSRAAFYHQFASKEDCFLAALDIASRWLCERVEAAVEGQRDWQERVRAAAAEALALIGANPLVGHLLAVEAPRAGQAARERHQALLDRFAAALRAGHPGRGDLPDDIADLLLGGVVTMVARYVISGRAEQLPEATEALVGFLLIPYLSGEEPGATLA